MKVQLFLLVSCISLKTVFGGIDFTLRAVDLEEDGVLMHKLYFTDGPHRIYYRPDPKWQANGDRRAALFRVEGLPNAFVKIENAPPGSADLPMDGAGLATLRKTARTFLPPDAEPPSKTWERLNPINLQGWKSYEARFQYRRMGHVIRESVIFINLDRTRQIRLIVSARDADFDDLAQRALRSLATWFQAPLDASPQGRAPLRSEVVLARKGCLRTLIRTASLRI